MSANENTPPSKRQRHDQPDSERPGERSSQLSCLELIPLEILAEVLSYANSPKDVLSVARCSKHLCATLLNPSNVTIWRRARRHCIVPDLPAPRPGWSEPAYAAFIFDEGPCYVCHAVTKRMFWSFVGRIRICGQHECRKELFSVHIRLHPPLNPDPNQSDLELSFLKERLNYLEVPAHVHGLFGPIRRYCLLTDLKETTSEFWEMIKRNETLDDYLNARETNTRKIRTLEHADLLNRWSQRWYLRYRTTKASNVDFARKLATNAGWKLEDLLNTSTYSSLNRSYNARLEPITEDDVRLLLTKIDAEILSKTENGERRQKARAQQMRRADITRHYNRLVEEKVYPVIPILAEFRELPIIKTLQDRDDAMPVLSDTSRSSAKRAKPSRVLESELKRSGLIGDMIDSDLKKWVHTALVAFDSMLGQPNWKSASTKFLHPAERVTARFICTLCRSLPKGLTAPKSLNFRDACAHECPGNAAAKRKWRADQFVPDQMAIGVLSMALSLLGLSAEDRETETKVELIDARFVCESCESPIVMNFQRLGGHWRRHCEMTFKLVSKADEAVALGCKPRYDAGSFAKYAARTKEAKEMRKMKVFGCRHCYHWRKRFTFDGLISHAKEKHKIFPLADEDFFRDTPIDAEGEHTEPEIITSVIGEIDV